MADAEKETSSWKNKMSELLIIFNGLSGELFSNKVTDSKKFEADVNKMYAISQEIDQRMIHAAKPPDSDPAIQFVSGMFRDDLGRASRSLKMGQVGYAKNVLKSSISYCIFCHTRNGSDHAFPLIKEFSSFANQGNWIEKISFLAATRNYEAVSKDVVAALEKENDALVNPLDLEKAVRINLAIHVRVKQDYAAGEALARSVLSSNATSTSLKKNAKQWIRDFEFLKGDLKKVYSKDEDLIKTARILLKGISDKPQAFEVHGPEVKVLRATALLHQLLGQYPQSRYTNEGLFLIGAAYDAMRDMGLWSLHEMYYYVCVEKQPHTDLAQKCYKRYKDSVVLGYAGSSGMKVPEAVQIHLNTLKRLADPATTTAPIH